LTCWRLRLDKGRIAGR